MVEVVEIDNECTVLYQYKYSISVSKLKFTSYWECNLTVRINEVSFMKQMLTFMMYLWQNAQHFYIVHTVSAVSHQPLT